MRQRSRRRQPILLPLRQAALIEDERDKTKGHGTKMTESLAWSFQRRRESSTLRNTGFPSFAEMTGEMNWLIGSRTATFVILALGLSPFALALLPVFSIPN
jgi:hypothetical protein